MVADTVVAISKKSQSAFVEYYKSVQDSMNSNSSNMRSKLERIDKEYQREVDLTEEQQRAKRANRVGNSNRYQNITIPVIKPQVEAAVSYQTQVYLTEDSMFGVVSDPQYIDAALQMQTILENNALRGGWTREFILFFRDAFKYNLGPIEVGWNQEVTYTVETDVTFSRTEGKPKEVVWSGNTIKRLDPYNTFFDKSVAPSEVYKEGEFAGYTEFKSRIALKQFINSLPEVILRNVRPAFESGTTFNVSSSEATQYYRPQINPDDDTYDYNMNGETNWLRWAHLSDTAKDIDYKNGYQLTTLYCKVIPSEFELRVPSSNTPQIYKLYIVNHEHIIYAERQTNVHGYLPILIAQPLEDGLRYQTKSLAEDGSDFQYAASAYMNSIIASRRRSATDRTLYDPSRIAKGDINSENPSAKIPVKPTAYGKNIAEAVYAFPYREDQAAISMQQISTLLSLADKTAGQNQARQGQFVKGNKSPSEFQEIMQGSVGRDQLTSLLIQAQILIPMKHILKTDILQYQGGTTLFNREKKVQVEIDPVKLRKAISEFRVSDGLIPSDKIINGEAYSVAMQVIGSSPQINSQYNIGPMFSYLMKTQGANIAEFEKSPEQVAYEQAMQQWQEVFMLAIDKGADLKSLPPQPLPQQFGYNPGEEQEQQVVTNLSEIATTTQEDKTQTTTQQTAQG